MSLRGGGFTSRQSSGSLKRAMSAARHTLSNCTSMPPAPTPATSTSESPCASAQTKLRLRQAESLVMTGLAWATRVPRLKGNCVGSAPDASEWITLITSFPSRYTSAALSRGCGADSKASSRLKISSPNDAMLVAWVEKADDGARAAAAAAAAGGELWDDPLLGCFRCGGSSRGKGLCTPGLGSRSPLSLATVLGGGAFFKRPSINVCVLEDTSAPPLPRKAKSAVGLLPRWPYAATQQSRAPLRTAASLESSSFTTSLVAPLMPSTSTCPCNSHTRAVSTRHAACALLFLDLRLLVRKAAYFLGGRSCDVVSRSCLNAKATRSLPLPLFSSK
mmetsp:Transcript_63783/g.128149  ORF Transcript_63783/g.128149 Transcript_63783/m.128149 type:complete len:333 (-) Transcript_63783:3216-4214(-)